MKLEGITIRFGGLNVVKKRGFLYSSSVQLGFLKANMRASLLKTQNDCTKWIYIHIGD